jgi:hypothetical protein
MSFSGRSQDGAGSFSEIRFQCKDQFMGCVKFVGKEYLMFKVRIAIALLALLLSFSAAAWAQTSGSVRGEINDPDGKPLPGVTVTISGPALIGGPRTAFTNELGVFRFPSLPVGTYSLDATMEGFQKVHVDRVDVKLDSTASVPFTMQLSQMTETVTTIGETPLIDVTDSGKPSSYKGAMLDEVPTQSSITDLMQVSPGITASTGDSSGDRTIALGSNMQSNAWHVDGVDTSAPETGSVWFLPNNDMVEEIQVIGVGAPAEYGNHTGAVFNVVTKKGGNDFHGSSDFLYQSDGLTGENVVLDDVGPGALPAFKRDKFHNIYGQLGGPILKDKLWFIGSIQNYRNASAPPGASDNFFPEVVSDKYDIKLTSAIAKNHEIGGFFHWEKWVSPNDSSPFVTPSATAQEGGNNPAYGVSWTATLSPNLLMEANYSGWWSDDLYQSQLGLVADPFFDFSPPGGGPTTYSGGIYYPYDYRTSRNQVNGKATYYAENFLKSQHEFKFGVQFSTGEAFTKAVSYGANGFYAYHYNYYGTDYFYRVYQNPFQYGAENKEIGVFLDDSITVGDRLTINAGIRFDHSGANIPDYKRLAIGTPSISPNIGNFVETGETVPGVDVIDWNVVSPRLGFVFQPQADGKSKISGSFGVYYDHDVTGNWDYPPPGVPPVVGKICNNTVLSECQDASQFSDNFTIPLDDVVVNKGIKAPRTLQYSVGFDKQIGKDMAAGVQYVYKDTKDLVGWHLEGGNYTTSIFTDPFTGTQYTVFNIIEGQGPKIGKGNDPGDIPGQPGLKYFQKYHGVLLTFEKRFSNKFGMNANYTWSKSTGLIPRFITQTQFNPFYGGRDGSDPNQYYNAEGRLQGDRPNMFRIQGVFFNLPGGMHASVAADFEDGRLLNREIRIPTDQGRVTVIMEREFQRLGSIQAVDVTVGKLFHLGSDVQFRVEGTVFNLFNADNALSVADLRLSDPTETFTPDTWTQPRRLQLRLGFQF